MSTIGHVTSRTTSQMISSNVLDAIRRTQQDLLIKNEEISSGKTVNRPSDSPRKVSAITNLQRKLAIREQQTRNLQHASASLSNTDQAIGAINDLLIEARSIASSQVGIGSNADTRLNQSTVIDGTLQALLDTANSRFQDIALFGGSYNPQHDGPVFETFLGGVRYLGTTNNLKTDVGLGQGIEINSNGEETFGALSARVKSKLELEPDATPATRIIDVNGATNEGVQLGSILIDVNGTVASVDLTTAETLADVVTRVNKAISDIDPAAGNLALDGAGFALNATGSITIREAGTGRTAGDLGLRLSASGTTVNGAGVGAQITGRTPITAFGGGIDWTSGLLITQGAQTRTADFSNATTVQDLQNVISGLNLGLRLDVNAAGTGLDLVSEVSGVDLSIGEVAGGRTASDLGLRTFGEDTLLADFRFGLGVESKVGKDDFKVSLHDGTQFNVNLDGVITVRELVQTIRQAAEDAGRAVGAPGDTGTAFNVGFASEGNGLIIEDQTTGGNDFQVNIIGESLAAENLGLLQSAGQGTSINTGDRTKVRVESVFTHLIQLRDSLFNDDSAGITFAGGAIEKDVDELARVQADVGVRGQRVLKQQERFADMQLLEQSLLSDLQDTDMVEALTKFTQLQQQLEASLKVGSQRLQLSLLDFLR
jgi:flagellar hook-associated protein 3 FlgL